MHSTHIIKKLHIRMVSCEVGENEIAEKDKRSKNCHHFKIKRVNV